MVGESWENPQDWLKQIHIACLYFIMKYLNLKIKLD